MMALKTEGCRQKPRKASSKQKVEGERKILPWISGGYIYIVSDTLIWAEMNIFGASRLWTQENKYVFVYGGSGGGGGHQFKAICYHSPGRF